MKKIQDNIKIILLAATFPILGALYPLFNSPGFRTHSLVTDLDRSIPFLKVFALPYITWYPYVALLLVYFFIKERKAFSKVIIVLDICLLAAFSTYVVYQTTVPRPQLIRNDTLTRLVGFIYNGDEPFNCFPSLHVIETYIMMKSMLALENRSRVLNILVQIIGILIILSTMFIKQHVILDAVYGILLVETVFMLIHGYKGGSVLQWIRNAFSSLMTRKKLEI